MALGEFMGSVTHDGRTMDILGDLPTECLIQQVILGCRGKILVAADHMGNAHGVVVHDIGKVVGRHTVAFDEDLIVQCAALYGHITVHLIMEGHGTLGGDFLANDIGDSRRQLFSDLLLGKVAAVTVIAGRHAGGLLHLAYLVQPLLIAEAVVGMTAFHQLLGVFLKHTHALTLNIGTDGAADIRSLVPQQAGLLQGLVDDLHSPLYLTLLVGILDAQQEAAVIALCHQIGKQCGAQVSHVHIAGGAGGKTGADMIELEHKYIFLYYSKYRIGFDLYFYLYILPPTPRTVKEKVRKRRLRRKPEEPPSITIYYIPFRQSPADSQSSIRFRRPAWRCR